MGVVDDTPSQQIPLRQPSQWDGYDLKSAEGEASKVSATTSPAHKKQRHAKAISQEVQAAKAVVQVVQVDLAGGFSVWQALPAESARVRALHPVAQEGGPGHDAAAPGRTHSGRCCQHRGGHGLQAREAGT